jgi:hypothetical protein
MEAAKAVLTTVANCHTTYYDRDDPGQVYVARPSKWGNPFKVGRDGGRLEVIEKYRKYVYRRPDLLKAISDGELTGKVLMCYCKPLACHGDVLAEMANKFGGPRS